jgi:ABC-type glycerol-3-phosphate transport system substrate-binding protein
MDTKKLSRRDFLRGTAMVSGAVLLAACAPKQAVTEVVPTTGTKALSTEPVKLRMWHWDNYMADGWKPVIAKFTEKHPNITVEIEMTDYGQYSQKVAAAIVGGAVPDVTGTIAEHFTNMAGQGQLIDLKPYVEGTMFPIEDFHPGNLSQNSWKGQLLSIPYTADGEWFFYQVDAFIEKGIKTPYEYWKEGNWTWDTATAVAEQLTSGEGVDKVFGWGGLGTGNYFEMLPYLASNGSGFFDEKYTTCLLNTPEAFELYQWGYENRKFAPGPEDQQNGTPQSGHVMMWLDWSPYGLVYSTSMPFKYSYAPPPSSPTTKKHVYCGDAPGFGILKGAKQPNESWAWIEFMNTPENLESVFLFTGTEPPRMSIATDPEMWKRNTKYPDNQVALELTIDRFKGFYNTPKTSNFVEMWQAHNEELSLAWADKQPLQDALNKANDRINALLKEANIDQDKLYWTA